MTPVSMRRIHADGSIYVVLHRRHTRTANAVLARARPPPTARRVQARPAVRCVSARWAACLTLGTGSLRAAAASGMKAPRRRRVTTLNAISRTRHASSSRARCSSGRAASSQAQSNPRRPAPRHGGRIRAQCFAEASRPTVHSDLTLDGEVPPDARVHLPENRVDRFIPPLLHAVRRIRGVGAACGVRRGDSEPVALVLPEAVDRDLPAVR